MSKCALLLDDGTLCDKARGHEDHGADDCAELAAAYVELQRRMIALGDDFAARAAPEPTGLDAERLARALHAFYASKDIRDEFFPPDCTHPDDARIIAAAYSADDPNDAIAAEYARLQEKP